VEIPDKTELGGGRGAPPAGGSRGGGDDSGGRGQPGALPEARTRASHLIGIYLALASITMFFMALASALLVRRGTGTDWQQLALPRMVWFNTALLIASSLTLEVARRSLEGFSVRAFRAWWGVTTILGTAFLAGQIVAWRQMADAGVFLATSPSSSFFYLLTGAHGLHLLGGVLALLYVALRPWPDDPEGLVRRSLAAQVSGVYWHFMDGLWVFLLVLMTFGR
jgi:cytochrome c oxidase subunit 3